VTSISDGIFHDNQFLRSIVLSKSVTAIGKEAFTQCRNLTSVSIPEGVTTIGNYAFSNCFSLKSISLPNSVTTIGDGAFWGCINLTSINIPDSVTKIGSGVLTSCMSLTDINIPDSITNSDVDIFGSCHGLVFDTPKHDSRELFDLHDYEDYVYVEETHGSYISNCPAFKDSNVAKLQKLIIESLGKDSNYIKQLVGITVVIDFYTPVNGRDIITNLSVHNSPNEVLTDAIITALKNYPGEYSKRDRNIVVLTLN
jgi:hypothetical protein